MVMNRSVTASCSLPFDRVTVLSCLLFWQFKKCDDLALAESGRIFPWTSPVRLILYSYFYLERLLNPKNSLKTRDSQVCNKTPLLSVPQATFKNLNPKRWNCIVLGLVACGCYTWCASRVSLSSLAFTLSKTQASLLSSPFPGELCSNIHEREKGNEQFTFCCACCFALAPAYFSDIFQTGANNYPRQ